MKTQSDDVRLNCIGMFSTSFILFFLSLKTWVLLFAPLIRSIIHETSFLFFVVSNYAFLLGTWVYHVGNNLVKVLGTPQSTIRLFLIDHSFTGKVKVLPISLINS